MRHRLWIAGVAAALGFAVAIVLIRPILAPPSTAETRHTTGSPIEHVVAPGGKIVYYVTALPGKDAEGVPNRQIEMGIRDAGGLRFEVLLPPSPSGDPEKNLTGFNGLLLSPDARTLYFNAWAWATSNAVHSLEVATKRVSFVTAGSIVCPVLKGEYQGDLIVQKHKYLVQGGSHDDLYLVDPSGKEVGLVAQGTQASQRVCATFGS